MLVTGWLKWAAAAVQCGGEHQQQCYDKALLQMRVCLCMNCRTCQVQLLQSAACRSIKLPITHAAGVMAAVKGLDISCLLCHAIAT
jgi:hypothetical protein